MKTKLPILLLVLFFTSPVLADSAVYHIADSQYEDTYSATGASNSNVFGQSSGWQYFGCSSTTRYNAYWRWAIDIPKGSTVTKSYIMLRADYSNSGSLSAAFTALAPDNRWESSNGFRNTNYPVGSDLDGIPRQGAPVTWDDIPDWAGGAWYASPDISGLLQARIENADYDPQDERGKYFGLALEYVSGSSYRTATQEPDTDTYTAQLYVEWIPGPPPPAPVEVEQVFNIAGPAYEDTFAASGRYDQNGFDNTYGWQYFGYAGSTASWYTAYWRWSLSIPADSIITKAYVKIRSDYNNLGYLDAALQALIPDGKWETGSGFSTINYPNGSSLNRVPRQGTPVLWDNVAGWTQDTWFYSPDVSALVQERIDNPDYDPESSAGRYFGVVLYHSAGSSYRTATQEPDSDTNTAQLFVRWIPANGCGNPYAVEICGDGVDNNCNNEIDEFCNACPTANAGDDLTGFVGQSVQIDGSGSSDLDGDCLSYTWRLLATPDFSFTDLSDPAAVMPEITLDRPGEYVVELVVSDGSCESVADTVTISTINSCPVADAGADWSVFVGETVFLDAGGSRDNDGDALEFFWQLIVKPEGSAAQLISETAEKSSFPVDAPGEYQVELRVNDGHCEGESDIVVVSTKNLPPVAEAGLDQEAIVGYPAQLDGRASYDPDGNAIFFFWTIISAPVDTEEISALGAEPELSDATSDAPQLLLEREGAYVLQLVVNDGEFESEPDTCVVTAVLPICPKGHGYWMNHGRHWPVDSLALGDGLYDKAELLEILRLPVKGDASILLARQLIAAKLNLENGSEPLITEVVNAADNLLRLFPGLLPYGVKPSTDIGREMNQHAQLLESYNQGLLVSDCVD